MRPWNAGAIAHAAGARVISAPPAGAGPERAVIDSRRAGPGTLFIGLPGTNADGGEFAGAALEAGAWGVLVAERHAAPLASSASPHPAILAASDPLAALQRLATAWREHIGAQVIGVTGSTGKTSTKDLLLALLAPHRRTVASEANFNTEIGLPLQILAAPAETEVLVLEMAMRGEGQIAELAAIARPDVGVIVNVGPVHLELLGTIERIAAAKAELLAGLPAHGTAVVPAGEPLLDPHLRADIETVTFGDGGDVQLAGAGPDRVTVTYRGEPIELDVPFRQAHLLTDLLAAVAAARAVGVTPAGRIEPALTAGRGGRHRLPGEITLIDSRYNANPMSMRAALQELAGDPAPGRRVAILGDMLELGPDARRFHEELSPSVDAAGVELLITVGPLAAAIDGDAEIHRAGDAAEAAELAADLVRPEDTVLVKGSLGVGLEVVCRRLLGAAAIGERAGPERRSPDRGGSEHRAPAHSGPAHR